MVTKSVGQQIWILNINPLWVSSIFLSIPVGIMETKDATDMQKVNPLVHAATDAVCSTQGHIYNYNTIVNSNTSTQTRHKHAHLWTNVHTISVQDDLDTSHCVTSKMHNSMN